MSDYTPEDIVKYSMSGDATQAQDTIKGVLANKVMKALEAKKAEVAQAMFNNAIVGEKPEVNVPNVQAPTPLVKPDNGMTTVPETDVPAE